MGRSKENSIKIIKWALLWSIALIIIGSLLGCEKEEVECKCDLEVTEDGISSYYVTGVPTDCNGNYTRPENVPNDHFIIGITNCR